MTNQNCENILTNHKFWYILLISLTIFIIGYLSYLITGTLLIIYDYDVCNNGRTTLWIYICITLILSLLQLIFISLKKNQLNNKHILELCLCEIGLVIFGFISLFINACNDLKNTNLWTFSLLTLIIQCLVTIFLTTYLSNFYRKRKSILDSKPPNISLDIIDV